MSRLTDDPKKNGAILREAIVAIADALKTISDEELGAVVTEMGTDQLKELMAVAAMARVVRDSG
jgi:metal-sulfur cluster biosynthetic enzyme